MDERIYKYIQGTLSFEDRVNFLHEVDSNENLKNQLIEYQNQYALLNLGKQLQDRREGTQKYDLFIQQKQQKIRLKRLTRWVGYAAAVVVLLLSTNIATYVFNKQTIQSALASVNVMDTLCTPAGQRAQLILQDGTKVWLNAASKLIYPAQFSSRNRTVTIEGEAFFKVAKDEARPFIVSVGNVDLKVLGTSFNVYGYPDCSYIQTALLEGSVSVFFRNKEKSGIVLKPNQQVTVRGAKMEVEPIQAKDHFLWREGIYAFENELLSDILKKLELYYDITIMVEDPSLFKERYTGKFRQRDSLDDIFRVLQQIRKFNVKKDLDQNTITLN